MSRRTGRSTSRSTTALVRSGRHQPQGATARQVDWRAGAGRATAWPACWPAPTAGRRRVFEFRGPVQPCCCTRWAVDGSDYSGIGGRSAFGARDAGHKHIAPPCVAPQQERCRQRCSGGQVVVGGRDDGGNDAGGAGGNAGGSARRQHQPRTRTTAAAAAAGAHTRETAAEAAHSGCESDLAGVHRF